MTLKVNKDKEVRMKKEIKRLREERRGAIICLKYSSTDTHKPEEMDFEALNIYTHEDFVPITKKKCSQSSFKQIIIDTTDPLKEEGDHLLIICDIDVKRRSR